MVLENCGCVKRHVFCHVDITCGHVDITCGLNLMSSRKGMGQGTKIAVFKAIPNSLYY